MFKELSKYQRACEKYRNSLLLPKNNELLQVIDFTTPAPPHVLNSVGSDDNALNPNMCSTPTIEFTDKTKRVRRTLSEDDVADILKQPADPYFLRGLGLADNLVNPNINFTMESMAKVKHGAEVFREHLLKTSVFKMGDDGKIKLFNTCFEPPGLETCSDINFFLYGLSFNLWIFFSTEYGKLKEDASISEMVLAVETLLTFKNTFIVYGIEEKKVKDTLNKLCQMRLNVKSNYQKKAIPPATRSELVALIYAYFYHHSKLPDVGIYSNIAHILKYLGLEKGKTEQISGRIKKDFERKCKQGKKIDFDKVRFAISKLKL